MMQGSAPPSSGHGSSTGTPPSCVFPAPSGPDVSCQPCPSTKEQAALGPYVEQGAEIGMYLCVHPLCGSRCKSSKTFKQMQDHVKTKTHQTTPPTAEEQAEKDKEKLAKEIKAAGIDTGDFELRGRAVFCTVCAKGLCSVDGQGKKSLKEKLSTHVTGAKGGQTPHMYKKTGDYRRCPENRKGSKPGKQVKTQQVHHCSVCGETEHVCTVCPHRNRTKQLRILFHADLAAELVCWLQKDDPVGLDSYYTQGVLLTVMGRYGTCHHGSKDHQLLNMGSVQLHAANHDVNVEGFAKQALYAMARRKNPCHRHADMSWFPRIWKAQEHISSGFEEYVCELMTNLEKALMHPLFSVKLEHYDRIIGAILSNSNGRVGRGFTQTLHANKQAWEHSTQAMHNPDAGKPSQQPCKAQTLVYVGGQLQFVTLGHVLRRLPRGQCYSKYPQYVQYLTPNFQKCDFNLVYAAVKRDFRNEQLQKITQQFAKLPEGDVKLIYQSCQWGPLKDGRHECELCGNIVQCNEDQALRVFRAEPHCHKACLGCDKPKCAQYHEVTRLIELVKRQRRLEDAAIAHATRHGGEFPDAKESQTCCDQLGDLLGNTFADVIEHVTGVKNLKPCCAIVPRKKRKVEESCY
jgi:hypothetical protein